MKSVSTTCTSFTASTLSDNMIYFEYDGDDNEKDLKDDG